MVDEVITKQELIDAQKDAQSLDDFINGGDEQIVVTRLLKEYPALANAIRQIYEKGGKFYPTLAAANADIANIRPDVYVITGDNGAYYKATAGATTLTKSPYDPLTQSKNFTMLENSNLRKNIESDIFVFSSNLFDKDAVTPNTSIDTDGTIIEDSSRWLSDYISCSPSDVFSITNGGYRVAFFDSRMNFISRTSLVDVSSFSIPTLSSIAFFRLSAPYNVATIQLNTGSTLLPLEAYSQEYRSEFIPVISPEMTDFFDVSNNLFNKDAVLLNTSIEADGTIVSDASRWLSDYISCSSREVFSLTNGSYRVAYFDADKKFIVRGGVNSNVLTVSIDPRIRFMRLSATLDANTVMLNKGSTLLAYESFGDFVLKKQYAPEQPPVEIPVISPEMTDFFDVSKNLFNKDATLLNTSIETDGTIIEDTIRWLSDYISVSPSTDISLPNASFRIACFDVNQTFIVRLGVAVSESNQIVYRVRSDTHFIRISGTFSLNEMRVNDGTELLPFQAFGEVRVKPEYLPSSDQPEIDIDEIVDQVQQRIGSGLNWEPSFPKLNFSIVESETWRTPMWMSSDGVVIYGAYGGQLLQSTDEWTTRVQIGTSSLPKPIAGIRTLDDGELLISTNRDEATATNSKVYKTIGYDRNNPSAATFKEVLTTAASQANINNRWGLTVYQNICTASDYGLRGENGAQNVYLSTDYGETWRLIFNLRTQVVEGRPPLTDSAHMHTVAYDPYFNRVWVCVGDNPNTATYYSDDLGETWTFVIGSTEVQYTGIIALPDSVVFGSDRAPNGVFAYQRKDRSEMPVIKPLFLINDTPTITHVFALPFKKDWLPNTPVYFTGNKTTESVNDKPVIMGFVDGKKAHLLYEHAGVDALETALGPTAQGNIISSYSTTGVAGQVIIKGQAPTWQKL